VEELASQAPLPPPIFVPEIPSSPPASNVSPATSPQPNKGGKDLYGKVPKKVDPIAKLSTYPWFYDTLSGSEADALLSGHPPGTFLFRKSSQNGYLAASYVDLSGVQRCLVGYDNDNFWMTDESTVHPEKFKSLDKLIEGFRSVFTTPLLKQAPKPTEFNAYQKIPTVPMPTNKARSSTFAMK